ncbi:receptor-like protein kinase [Corchorus olitorius]|uniref:RING-type E3 ubiquitin transferase n=1 Tax=Corchorus olitorius TaxID=93759 RepID=A0A1R3GES7_9ROSI|nr:receptor-like protein kinase [Corchorus olitorius]
MGTSSYKAKSRTESPFKGAAAIAPPSNQDGCDQTRCKRGQPPVRFPFRLKGRQPDHCGASGFDLSCNNSNQTVLEIPTSVKLLVKRIDYIKQRIQVYDEESCIQKQLPNLTISSSPFTLVAAPGYEGMDSLLQNNSLFKCLAQRESDYINFGIPCLNQPGFYVKFVNLDFVSGSLLNCSKVADAVEVPIGLTRSNIIDNNFHFNWSEPACGSCEAKGNGCRANPTNPLGIECYYIHRDNKVHVHIKICKFKEIDIRDGWADFR